MIRQFFRSVFKDPPSKRFDPSKVIAYHGSYVGGDHVYECNVTAHLASGATVDLTAKELEDLIQDDLYFIGEHPLIEAMRKKR